MATNNPFGKFKADSDSEEEIRQPQKPIQPLDQSEPSKKKKKVRPEKQQQDQPKEDNEGFEEVGKKLPKKKKEHVVAKSTQENADESFPKKDFRESGHMRGKPGNPRGRGRGREFDRRSGTGRGREIAKGGAGGKHTWGTNPRSNAREYENSNDDYLIDRALHPEKRERRRFYKNNNDEQQQQQHQHDKKEEQEHKAEEGVEQQQHNDVNENEGEVKERKERKDKTENNKPEVKEEEKLKLPTNAISLEEYLANKQPSTTTTTVKQVEKPKETQNLKIKEKEETNTIGLSGTFTKKGKKQKEKKINKAEEELNQQVFENIKIGEDRTYNRRDNYHQKGKKHGKFQYNPDEFPEL